LKKSDNKFTRIDNFFDKLYKITAKRIEADYKIALKRHSLSDARYFEYIDSLDKEHVLKLAGISIDRY